MATAFRAPAGARAGTMGGGPSIGGTYISRGQAIRSLGLFNAEMAYETRFPEIIAGMQVLANKASEEEAAAILEDVKQRAPFDTGTLRDGYYVSQDEFAEEDFYITTDVYYAPFVEFGTVNMAAQPHVLPALEAHRTSYISAEVQAMRDACA
jgi:HK97 gp10 family phage protein